VFTDNLFDKIDFIEDDSMPINFDFNGYWPKLPSELVWNYWYYTDSYTLQSSSYWGLNNGANEQVLTSAPQYQTGPFGKYYLPSSYLPNTPHLYGAGSQPAAAAELFHYTTRVDQLKEGLDTAKANVNIGLHYIATTGQSSNVPNDADSDGIPDYVENWHGDGDTGQYRNHIADETDLKKLVDRSNKPRRFECGVSRH